MKSLVLIIAILNVSIAFAAEESKQDLSNGVEVRSQRIELWPGEKSPWLDKVKKSSLSRAIKHCPAASHYSLNLTADDDVMEDIQYQFSGLYAGYFAQSKSKTFEAYLLDLTEYHSLLFSQMIRRYFMVNLAEGKKMPKRISVCKILKKMGAIKYASIDDMKIPDALAKLFRVLFFQGKPPAPH